LKHSTLGYSVVAVSRRLGHAKPSITRNVYGHLMPTDDRHLAAGLHRVTGRRPGYLLVSSILYPSAGGGSVSSTETGVVSSDR
jgi:hypothetical protein